MDKDSNYLFGEDPFAPPQDHPMYVQDLNTREAYWRAYRTHITDQYQQISLPQGLAASV